MTALPEEDDVTTTCTNRVEKILPVPPSGSSDNVGSETSAIPEVTYGSTVEEVSAVSSDGANFTQRTSTDLVRCETQALGSTIRLVLNVGQER